VSDRTAQLALLNRGFVVRPADSNRAIAALRCIHAQSTAMSLETFLGDCQAWWYPRTGHPLFAHALGLRPFELLPRACLARLVSGNPQAPSAQTRVEIDDDLGTYLVLGRGDGKTDTFDELLAFARDVAGDNGSKDDGRRKVIDRISLLLPSAAREGLAQVLVLAGTRHALRAGGIRGTLWAPTTTADYLGAGMKRLLSILILTDPNQMDSAQWHAAYSEVLALVSESARTKFGAYLQVFHRFLTLLGMEPLSQPLPGSSRMMLPAATVVWEHELERAIDYVMALAPSERMGLQAQAVLRLGYHVPMRTAEFLCLRVGDVSCASGVSVVIYPRRRDGVGKSFSVRRVEDIDDFDLRRVLIQMVRLRRADGAESEDVLLGHPGPGEVRHEPGATMALVNKALRWATGDRGASVYDLRHACFSRRAALVLGGNHVI
jgi:integrase